MSQSDTIGGATFLAGAVNAPPRPSALRNVLAMAGVVVKEMYRRKDFYVLLIITIVITCLMGSVRFFHDDRIVRYLKENCLLLIWGASLAIAISTVARQLPAEKENRTIFPLLAKPVSRRQVVMGKFLGCWIACGIALVCFYAFFGIICLTRERHWPLVTYFQAATLHWFALAVVIAMALLGSLVFAAPSSNGTICIVVVIGILLVGRHLNQVALRLSEPLRSITYGIYYAMPHLEIFNARDLVIHDWPPIGWKYFAIANAYALAYAGLLLGAARLIFRRKPLN